MAVIWFTKSSAKFSLFGVCGLGFFWGFLMLVGVLAGVSGIFFLNESFCEEACFRMMFCDNGDSGSPSILIEDLSGDVGAGAGLLPTKCKYLMVTQNCLFWERSECYWYSSKFCAQEKHQETLQARKLNLR
jgi:hypothetical protein